MPTTNELSQDEVITLIEMMPNNKLALWLKLRLDLDQYTQACRQFWDIINQRLTNTVLAMAAELDLPPDIDNFSLLSDIMSEQVATDNNLSQILKVVVEEAMLDGFDILIAKYNLQ
jgi:hypothetical protein